MEILPNENDNSRYQLVSMNENFQTNQEDSLDNIKLNKSSNLNYVNSFSIQYKQKSKTSLHSANAIQKNSVQNNTFYQTTISETTKKPFAKIIIFFHMQTFIKKLLRSIRPPQQLTKEQITILSDKASSYKNLNFQQTKISLLSQKNITIESFYTKITQLQRDVFAHFLKISEKLLYNIPLIDPYNIKKIIWDAFMTTLRINLLFWIPIIIAFDDEKLENYAIINFLIFSFIFLVDIFLQTFTIKFDKGLPVKDRKTLLKQQCNFWTIIELLCVLMYFFFAWQFYETETSISLLSGIGWTKGLLVLVYFQIRNILQFVEDIQYLFRLNKKLNTLIELMKLIGLILLVQHFFSSIWIIIGTYSYQAGMLSWMEQIQDTKWIYIYLDSLYFTSVTTYTVGFGDICPKNTFERTFLCFYMLICSLQLSYSVNTIGSILTLTKQVNEEIKQKMTIITEYMKNKHISFALQYKVREYFNFYYLQENQQIKLEKMKLIDILPEQLQLDLKMEAADILIKKCQFFSSKFSSQYKEKLLSKSIFQTYQPGIVISNLENLYIIEQGQVEIMQGSVKIKTLNQYDYFSHNKIINYQTEQLVYRTSTFASILIISRDDLVQFLIHNQNEYEKLQEVGDPNLKRCYLCKKQHKTENCCLFHFNGDKEKIIKSYLFKCKQYRKYYQRKTTDKKINRTFNEYEQKQEEAQLIQEDHQQTLKELYPEIRDPQITQIQNSVKPKLDDYYRRVSVCLNENIEIGQSAYLNQESQLLFLEQKYTCLEFFQQKEKEEIQLLYLQQFNILSQKDLQIEKFEQIKQFNYFKPEWNIDNVIHEMKNKTIIPHNYNARSKFKYYTFYPMIFYDQYKKRIRSQTKLELNDDKIQSPDDKRFRLRRLLRKTQIQPI